MRHLFFKGLGDCMQELESAHPTAVVSTTNDDAVRTLQLAASAAELGIFDWDLCAQTASFENEWMYHILGQDPVRGAVSTADFYACVLHPDDVSLVQSRAEAAVQSGQLVRVECRIRRLDDGALRWVEICARYFPRPLARLGRLIGTFADITERKAMTLALAKADRQKDEFLAMLAHELRNPLAPIRTAAELIKSIEQGADPRFAWARHVIERQSQHLARLLEDLLDVSRITTGKVTVHRKPLVLQTVLARAQELVQPLIDGRAQTLSVHMPEAPIHIDGDLTRLTQVVSNLLDNAAKYTDEGGKIELTAATTSDHQICVRVKDNGSGIPERELPFVFEIFTQGTRSLDRSRGGLGIGLSVVKSIVELHGGSVTAASAGSGRGSEFSFRLPVVAAPAHEVAEPAPLTPQAGRTPMRVLVVDDNIDAADSLAMLLETREHSVQTAHDGSSAIAKALEFKPDVILLDIGLPLMDGYEVARRMEGLDLNPRPVLIALTGYGQAEDIKRSLASGFSRHLAKPVEPDLLLELIESFRPSP